MAATPKAGEFELIRRHFAPLAAPSAFGLRDDAATLAPPPGSELVLTVDAMVEGVHFLPDDPPDLVSRKLLRVNLSDLAAKGARPLGYLLTAAWTAALGEDWIAAFAGGLADDQRRYDCSLLGGDTVSTPGPLWFSLTAIGAVPAGAMLRRSGARPGDLVFVSGSIGDGALGLRAIRGELPHLDEADRAFLADRYRLPQPRVALGPRLVGLASAAMDVSDGLIADLGHMAEASSVAAVVEAAQAPLSPAGSRADRLDLALTGGDDYEILFTAPPGAEAAVAALAGELSIPLARIGRIEAGAGVTAVNADGAALEFTSRGWRHF
jgi:thiamine-monophosphate kinase